MSLQCPLICARSKEHIKLVLTYMMWIHQSVQISNYMLHAKVRFSGDTSVCHVSRPVQRATQPPFKCYCSQTLEIKWLQPQNSAKFESVWSLNCNPFISLCHLPRIKHRQDWSWYSYQLVPCYSFNNTASSSDCSVQWQDSWWTISLRRYERNKSGPNLSCCPKICLVGLEKTARNLSA